MTSKFELYRITPTTDLGKFFSRLPYRDKQSFFEAGRTITWKKMYKFCTEKPNEKEVNGIAFERTINRIFRLLEIKRTKNVYAEFTPSDWYKIENNEIIFTEKALQLIA